MPQPRGNTPSLSLMEKCTVSGLIQGFGVCDTMRSMAPEILSNSVSRRIRSVSRQPRVSIGFEVNDMGSTDDDDDESCI